MFWKRRGNVNVDAAWKQQNREQGDNPLYRYINLDKEGKFVDTYVEYGPEACELVIATEIEPFLYNQGKGKVVDKIDYLRWQNKVEAKMSVSTDVYLKLFTLNLFCVQRYVTLLHQMEFLRINTRYVMRRANLASTDDPYHLL